MDIFKRPPRKVSTSGAPLAKVTRAKPAKNTWVDQEKLGQSKDQRTDPRSERNLVLGAVSRDLSLYRFASDELRSDRRWVCSVVEQDWRALEHTSDELKDDAAIVLSAVKQDGRAMAFASQRRRNDREIVLAVLQAHPHDTYVAAESCRSLARLATAKPDTQAWLGSRGGCEAVASALKNHSSSKAVQLQGCRAVSALAVTLGADKLPAPHASNQSKLGAAGCCQGVIAALVLFASNGPLASVEGRGAAVSAGKALVWAHSRNRAAIKEHFEAHTAEIHTTNLEDMPKAQRDALQELTLAVHQEVLGKYSGPINGATSSDLSSFASLPSSLVDHGARPSSPVARTPRVGGGPEAPPDPLSPSKFQVTQFKARPLFERASQFRGSGPDPDKVFAQIRGDGGAATSARRMLLKNVDYGIGLELSQEDEMDLLRSLRPRVDRPPRGKPEGLNMSAVAFMVTGS